MRHLFFSLLLVPPIGLFAQAEIPRLMIKANATALINPAKQAVAFAADVRVAPRFSVDAGVGAIVNSTTFAPRKGDAYHGLRLRTGFKYFIDRTQDESFHIGLEAKYHDVTNTRHREVLRQGGQYIQIMPTDRLVETFGLAGRMGWQFYSGARRQLLIELHLGAGAMWHTVTRAGLPPDAEFVAPERRIFSFEYQDGKSRTLDLLFGVHVGYVLW